MNIDRSEVGAFIAALLVVFSPLIHRSGLDQYLNFDLSSLTTLGGVVVLAAAWLIHRRDKAA